MSAERRKQVFLAWLLFIVMQPFFVVKMTHRHDPGKVTCDSSETHQAAHHAQTPDHCLICHLFLTPFLEADSLDIQFIATFISVARTQYPEKRVYQLSYSHYLRAPPVA